MHRNDNFSKFQELRKEFHTFTYDSFRYSINRNKLVIGFSFSLGDKYFFNPEATIPLKENLIRSSDRLSPDIMDNLVFHIGMIELISYWKAACPPEVLIKPFHLSRQQMEFWKKIYFHGLGEFFYLNSIPAGENDFMQIINQSENQLTVFDTQISAKSLVPVGGGKDSALTMSILNDHQFDWIPMSVNPKRATREVINAAGISGEDTLDIFRDIDPQLLRLNGAGFLNGHTPFSAALAFYSLLAAYLTNRANIILSNESSANETTVPGTSVNHQYSKTIQFERDFREYTREFISPGFNYFSLLRPLSEIQIAKLFSRLAQFHPHFRSCNAGSKTGTWCGKCPKCLFTFIILSPFLEPDYLTNIFGSNLLEDVSLEKIFRELTGKEETKPFECIGTVDEVNFALQMAVQKYPSGNLPWLLRLHHRQSEALSSGDFPELLTTIDTDHCVPRNYSDIIEKLFS